jgi:hypothetical protein
VENDPKIIKIDKKLVVDHFIETTYGVLNLWHPKSLGQLSSPRSDDRQKREYIPKQKYRNFGSI